MKVAKRSTKLIWNGLKMKNKRLSQLTQRAIIDVLCLSF